MNDIIKFENVKFEYKSDENSVKILDGLDLSFEKGTFTALLGRNGSGKSTVAKLMNGLIKPQSGRVLVNGMDTADDEKNIDIKKTVGMVFQNPDNQLVATIVEEDVAFGLENLGFPPAEIRAKVDEALRTVDMYEYRESAPHNLSGGQKQRVAIAGIIAMQPECIVLDEPTAMLDPKGRREVISTVTDLCRRHGITIILITHFMEEAALADRVVVLDGGAVVLDDKPERVFSHVDMLLNLGLSVTQPTELLHILKKSGIDLSVGITSVDGCVEALTRIFMEEK